MTVTFDATGLRESVRELYAQRCDDAVTDLLADMERDAPRDTGAMTQTMTVEEVDSDTTIARRIAAPAEYASYQDEGVEGPIYPVHGKFLRFTAKDGSIVFVRSTSGVPRTGWFSDKVADWSKYVAAVIGR